MDVLYQELNKKRKESSQIQSKKRFQTRGEIEVLKEEKKKKKQKNEKKEGATTTVVETVQTEIEKELSGDDSKTISPQEVMLRLRAYGQPITLFGENDITRLERLKIFEITQHERETGASAGRTNIFQEIMTQEVETELLRASVDALTEDEKKRKRKRKSARRKKSKQICTREKKSWTSNLWKIMSCSSLRNYCVNGKLN